ncbi:MAG TPA: hypothetical protein PLE22_00190 [Acidovorax sp.]|jgi:hypothetical protein|nr:hypothetical protein [Acidovorax sp.]
MKPRLKLSATGELFVISPGSVLWSEKSAKLFLTQHYGSVKAFSDRFGCSYSAAIVALASPWARQRAGKVAKVRQILGLPSTPTQKALISAAALQRKEDSISLTRNTQALKPMKAKKARKAKGE